MSRSRRRPGPGFKMTRRQSLATLASTALAPLVADPLRVAAASLVDGIISRAQATETGARPRNYIFTSLAGGPARWVFDGLLNPYTSDSVVSSADAANGVAGGKNGQVMTRFSGSTPIYQTNSVTTARGRTLRVPTLWGATLPRPDGTTVPMTSLLENLLIIRGIDMMADGHTTNHNKQLQPLSSAPSLDGQVADQSHAMVPAVSALDPGYQVFRSKSGVGLSPVNPTQSNPLGTLLNPFDTSADGLSNGYLNRRAAISGVIDAALKQLGAFASSQNPGADALYATRSRAEQSLRNGFGDLKAVYATLLAKYRSLIAASAAYDIPGINDQPIPMSTDNAVINQIYDIAGSGFPSVPGNPDHRTLIARGMMQGGQLVPVTLANGMAEGFAIAEFMIGQGYSNSITIGSDPYLVGLHYDNLLLGQGATPMGPVNGRTVYRDEHNQGVATSIVLNAFLFRSYASCLFELIAQLKAANLFNETVIQMGSEFNRYPRVDGSGSDHGWMGNLCTLWSGAIDGPYVLGNIAPTPGIGLWGAAGPTTVEGSSVHLNMGHATSTVAALLRVDPPMPNNSSLVIEKPGGGLTPLVDLAKEVDHT